MLRISSLHGDEVTFTPRKRVKQMNPFPQTEPTGDRFVSTRDRGLFKFLWDY